MNDPKSASGTQIGVAAPGPTTTTQLAVAGLVPGGRVKQYELIRELGRGGMGVVFAARDTRLGRRVAMKFLHSVSREVTERFLTEARATAQCNHDNIVIIYEVDEHAGMPYMVLEYLEGQPLRAQMGAFGEWTKLPPSRAIELALPIARALARAHGLGIVHRDLKPENVMVTTQGQVKVLDFGIAKALGEQGVAKAKRSSDPVLSPSQLGLTQEGAMIGTLPYMSPEQMGADTVDHRADIYALGVIMFEMLAGQHPVDPLTVDGLIQNGTNGMALPSLGAVAPEVPRPLVELVDACLQKRKADRIDDAALIARKLEELLPGRRGRELAEGESPYPGLTAFQESDADRFFGRARDVARAVARVRELPLVGIVGPSGVGKSSFVRAGIGPALKAVERWEIVSLRPGRQPLAALASVLERLTSSGATTARHGEGRDDYVEKIRREPGFLGARLRARARELGGHILLFVDQLEELYTLVPDPAERRAFTAALTGVADDTAAPLRVVVSMRSDFVDRIAEDPRFLEELSRGLVFLSPPDRDGLRDALVQPVELVGYRFETEQMVEDMLDALVGTPGALPLLQFAAAKLWDARDRDVHMLRAASYAAIGGISGALATHADDVIAQMNGPAQKLAQRIFRRLVTPERTRAIVELADLYEVDPGRRSESGALRSGPDRGEVARVIEQLVAARLLVVQTRGDAGGGSVELVHESLIDRWPTLRRWLDEDQEDAAFLAQLAAAAKQWDAKSRPSGLLWRGDAMEEARRWDAQRARELPARDRAFLDAVLALGKRRARQRRIALIGTFALLGLIAAGASVAFVLVRGAEREAHAALAKVKAAEEARHKAMLEEKTARDQFDAAESAKDKAEADAQNAATEAERETAKARVAQAEKEQAEAAAKIADAQRQKADADKQNLLVEKQRAEEEMQAAEAAKQRAEAARQKAEAERKRALAAAQKAQDEAKQTTEAAAQSREQMQRRIDELSRDKDQLQQRIGRLQEQLQRLQQPHLRPGRRANEPMP